MEYSQIFGWTATILFSSMLLPQIIKTIKLKDTTGVSISLFIIYFLANIVAIIYALMIKQYPLMIKYNLGILTTIFYITLFLCFYWQKKKGKTTKRKSD